MKKKFIHIKDQDNLFLHKRCQLYHLDNNTAFCTIEYVESIFKNISQINAIELEMIIGSLCKRCYNVAITYFTINNVIPSMEL